MALITAATAALVSMGVGAATAAAVAPVAVSLAGGIGLSLLANALAPAEAVTQAGAAASGYEKEISDSTVQPRTWLVGRYVTAGSHVYSQVSDVKPSGENHSGPEQNRYYDTIIALADHECAAFNKLSVNDEWRTGTDLGTPGSMGSAVSGFTQNGQETLYVKFFAGTEGQSADQRLLDASRERDDFSLVWTSNHRLRGVCYARLTAKYDEKKHKDWPTAVFVVDGAKFWDPRLDGTVPGGTGAHRYGTPNTWEWTRNPAVMLAHFIRGWRFPGDTIYVGPQGTTLDVLDLDSFQQAADDCDDNITLNGGGTEKRYRCGFEFTVDMDNAAIAETLLSSMAGRLCWTGARWRLFAGKTQTAVASITDDDIRIDLPREFDPKVGLAELVNRVTAEYTDDGEDWSVTAAQPRSSSEDQEEDGDRQLTLDLPLHAVQSNTQAQRIMEIARRQSREQKRHRVALPPKFLSLEVGDWINWTSTRWGYAAKPFRIDNVEIAHDLTIFVHLAECNTNVFAWDETVDELDKTIKDLAPGGDPDDDVNLDLTAYTFVDRPYTNRAQVGIGVTWVDLENRRVRTIEIQWRRSGGTRVFTERVEADELVWETTKSIREDTLYQIRARPRFNDNSYGDWTSDGWTGADEITSGFEFDAADAPTPIINTIEGLIRPSSGDKRRALLAVSWTNNSMKWPTTGDPVDSRIVGFEIRYRQDGEADGEWQSETSRDLTNRSFRVYKGIRADTTYEYQVRFLFSGGDVGNWSTQADVVVPAIFVAGSSPVPDVAGATITAQTTTGDGGTQRAFFKIAIPADADARIRGVLFEYKKDADADAEAVQKFFRGYTSIKLAEGIQKRTSYSFRAAFVFDQDHTGNFSSWRTGQVANDYLADPPDDAGADNEVPNWSFERADSSTSTGAVAWTHETGSGFTRASGNAEHGDYALGRSATGNAAVEPIAERRLETRSGNVFNASVQVKRTGTVTFDSVIVRVVFRDKAGTATFFGDSITSVGTTYQAIRTKDREAPADAYTVSVRVVVVNQAGGGTLWVDSVTLRRQSATRDMEAAAVDGTILADGAVVEGKFDSAVVLPVGAKVRIDGSTTIDANKPADVINTVTAQKVYPNSVRLTNSPTESDTLGTLLEGSEGARTIKGAKLTALSITDAQIASDAITTVKIAADAVESVKIKAKNIDVVHLKDKSTATIKSNPLTAEVVLALGESNVQVGSVNIECKKGSRVVLTFSMLARAAGFDGEADMDLDIRRTTGTASNIQSFNSIGNWRLRVGHSFTTVEDLPNALFGSGDDDTATINYICRVTHQSGDSVLITDRCFTAINLRQAAQV